MSLTAEELARREWEYLTDPSKVRIKIKVSWKTGFCLPDPQGDQEERAVFSRYTFGDNWIVEHAVSYEMPIPNAMTAATVKVVDIHEYKRLLVKRNLLEWSLDVPIVRDEGGWMTPESYARVSKIPAPLMEAFLQEYDKTIEVSEEEEQKISRQCAVLFSKNGHGVTDACEAVSLFCTLGNYWEKFGLNKESLPKMPYKEYLLLKVMVGKEGDSMRQQAAPRHGSEVKIAGAGGKIRPSRGTRIAM